MALKPEEIQRIREEEEVREEIRRNLRWNARLRGLALLLFAVGGLGLYWSGGFEPLLRFWLGPPAGHRSISEVPAITVPPLFSIPSDPVDLLIEQKKAHSALRQALQDAETIVPITERQRASFVAYQSRCDELGVLISVVKTSAYSRSSRDRVTSVLEQEQKWACSEALALKFLLEAAAQ